MQHDYVEYSNAAGYGWQSNWCHKTMPYPSPDDNSACPGAPCLCDYKQNVCPLHDKPSIGNR